MLCYSILYHIIVRPPYETRQDEQMKIPRQDLLDWVRGGMVPSVVLSLRITSIMTFYHFYYLSLVLILALLSFVSS